ncbi:MAG: TM2 domain-containing protein [Alistipes sp.]|nr:TM2 domain-containing protein [Alistipes sp.]
MEELNNAVVKSSRNWIVALLLCWFFGALGVHRFYVGKTGTGIAQLLTLGGLGIWVLIDFIMILVGAFTDNEGNRLRP